MFEFLKKIRFKKKSMDNPKEIDLENLDKELRVFSYQWTKGENNGQLREYDSVFKDAASGIIWINFKGGTRINYDLLNEYMIQIDKTVTESLQTPVVRATVQERIPTASGPVKNVQLSESFETKLKDENPIVSLLQKQKPNWVEVGIKLKLNLPTKNLYEVLTSSFEDAENEITEFVVSDLDLEIIKESLRINIREIYKGNGSNIRKTGNNINKEGE